MSEQTRTAHVKQAYKTQGISTFGLPRGQCVCPIPRWDLLIEQLHVSTFLANSSMGSVDAAVPRVSFFRDSPEGTC